MLFTTIYVKVEVGQSAGADLLVHIFAEFMELSAGEFQSGILLVFRQDGKKYSRFLGIRGNLYVRDGDERGAIGLALKEDGRPFLDLIFDFFVFE